MYICENAENCDDDACLEKEPHEKKPWCLRKSKCANKGLLVKCRVITE